MFRSTSVSLHYFGKNELFEMSRMLGTRGRYQTRLGIRQVRHHLKMTSLYRTFRRPIYERGLTRAQLQGAYLEHGTDYREQRNDLSRQKIIIDKRMLTTLAQYEPMSFRAVLELSSSAIPPPPPPAQSQQQRTQQMSELDEAVEALTDKRCKNALASMKASELKEAWKKYDVGAKH